MGAIAIPPCCDVEDRNGAATATGAHGNCELRPPYAAPP